MFFMTSCGTTTPQNNYATENDTVTTLYDNYEEEEEIDPFYGLAINPFTGMWVSEELVGVRPYAVVINNLPRALPQSGISEADIIYEVLAEGGITRLLAVFTNATASQIGPIRSTRDYFAHIATNHNSVLVHHGGSPTGYNAINNLGIQNLDGMALEGIYFWRDQERWRQPGMREHSSYTNQENIHNAMENRGFSMYHNSIYMFNFYEEHTAVVGNLVNEVILPFSGFQTSSFIFDENTHLFNRYQRNEPHVDEYSNTQISVSNIIIQQVPKNVIAGDAEGRMNVNLIGNGFGYLVTAGVYTPITWERQSTNTATIFSDTNGNPLTLNPGKTWISILQISATPQFNYNVELDDYEVNATES